jgi:hypothetical protein
MNYGHQQMKMLAAPRGGLGGSLALESIDP